MTTTNEDEGAVVSHAMPYRGNESTESVIAPQPPEDGREWDCQCARCGSSMSFKECWACGGEGQTEPGELHEMDPLWYDPEDTEPCDPCRARGGWWQCLSDEAWCNAHPMPCREATVRGEIEWFTSIEVHEKTAVDVKLETPWP